MTNADSVKARLKNKAISSGKTMQEMLTAYGLERTIYRISISDYADRFTLKGGIFLYALFQGEFARATKDIDLLAEHIPNDREEMLRVFRSIFSIQCDDAIRYDLSSVSVVDITEFNEYHGVNVSVSAYLDRTEIPISIDIGFGDVVYPNRVKMDFPVLLNMQTPEVYAYSVCSVIAEKFEAIVSLGDANSRYKDFYDICILAAKYPLEGTELKEAVWETFDHRGTGFDDIVAFGKAFAESRIHKTRWDAFIKKKKALVQMNLETALETITRLLMPIVESIQESKPFRLRWNPVDMRWEE